MKFLFDVGVSHRSAEYLNTLGHEATHLRNLGLQRLPDPKILHKALDEARVIVTHDLDFGELVAKSENRLPSVISFRLRDMRHKQVNFYLDRILQDHQDDLCKGAILSVTEGRIRIRRLPMHLK